MFVYSFRAGPIVKLGIGDSVTRRLWSANVMLSHMRLFGKPELPNECSVEWAAFVPDARSVEVELHRLFSDRRFRCCQSGVEWFGLTPADSAAAFDVTLARA